MQSRTFAPLRGAGFRRGCVGGVLAVVVVLLLGGLKGTGQRGHGDRLASPQPDGIVEVEQVRPAGAHDTAYSAASARTIPPRAAPGTSRATAAAAAPDTVTITGIVIDLLGGAIAGAAVQAIRDPDSTIVASTVSDSAGRFVLDVAEGAVTLEVQAAHYSVVTQASWAPGREVTIGLLPSSTIVGRVVAVGDPVPIAGALVKAENIGGLRAGVRTATTRDDGGFEITDVPAGEYELTLQAPRWTAQGSRLTVPVGGSSDPVLLGATAAGLLRGSVTVNGKPCAEGYLELLGAGATSRPLSAAGSACFEGLAPGTLRVAATCTRPSATMPVDEMMMTAQEVAKTWDLTPLPQFPEARDVAPSDAARGDLLVQIAGQSADQDSLVVVLTSLTAMPVRRRVDAGQALFTGLAPGGYSAFLDVAPDARVSIVVLPDVQSQLTLAIPRLSEISGRVVDEAGSPIPDVWVRLLDPARALDDASALPTLTDGDGIFSFSGRFSGPYAVAAEIPTGVLRIDDVPAGTHDVMLRVQ